MPGFSGVSRLPDGITPAAPSTSKNFDASKTNVQPAGTEISAIGPKTKEKKNHES